MERWKNLTAVAEREHGVVTHDQLRAAGLSDRQIRHWASDGRLVSLGYAVYRIGGVAPSFEGAVLAAVREFPGETWASHHTAARLLGLGVWGRDPRLELTRPTGLSAERSAARVHRSNRLPAHHLTQVGCIPCLTASRTLFDLARVTGPKRLRRGIDQAMLNRQCTVGSLYRVMYDLGGRGRPGTRRMREVLDALGPVYVPPESELEVVGYALLDGLGFGWQVEMSDEQGYIRRVDGLEPASGLVVEFDGRQHDLEPQRSCDRAGDRRLLALGHPVERLVWDDVSRLGDATRARIARLVGAAAA